MLWEQRDAPQMVRDALRRAVGDREMVRDELSDGWTPDKPPEITVVSDGTPVPRRGWTSELVRVAVHARDKPTSRKLMTQIDSFLLTPLAAGWAMRIEPATGLIATIDNSRVGGGLSSVTYRVTTSKRKR